MTDFKTHAKFFSIARAESEKSTCLRAESRMGAIAVKDGKVIARGHNGSITGVPTCATRGYCVRQKMEIPSGHRREIAYCICAEQRLICNAVRDGISLRDSEIYVTDMPCTICVRLLIECGVKRIYHGGKHNSRYINNFTKEICDLTGFEIIQI